LHGSRKYPHPHHGGNWKFLRGGGGGSKAQENPEERGGGTDKLLFRGSTSIHSNVSFRYSSDIGLLSTKYAGRQVGGYSGYYSN